MARAMEPAPSPPEAGYRGCHSPVTRLLPSLGCRAAALSGGAVPHLSRSRFSLCARPRAARSPTRFLPNYCQALRARRGRRRVEGKASGAVSQGNLSPELSSSPRWDASSASSLETSHPALRVLLPALRPYGDSHKQGPEPRPGAEGAARRSSKEEQRNSPVLQSTGGRGVRGGTIPPAHTPVWAVSAEEPCRRHFSPHPLWYKPKQLSALHIFPCNLSLRYTSDLLISQMGKGSSAKL